MEFQLYKAKKIKMSEKSAGKSCINYGKSLLFTFYYTLLFIKFRNNYMFMYHGITTCNILTTCFSLQIYSSHKAREKKLPPVSSGFLIVLGCCLSRLEFRQSDNRPCKWPLLLARKLDIAGPPCLLVEVWPLEPLDFITISDCLPSGSNSSCLV